MLQAIVCLGVATLMGCASPANRANGELSPATQNAQRAESPAVSQVARPQTLDGSVFRELNLNGDGAVTIDDWRHFDTSDAAKENFSALGENGDGQINARELPMQAPRHSRRFQFLGGATPTNDEDVFPDTKFGGQRGWPLFSLRF
jgi:hypothetical protein